MSRLFLVFLAFCLSACAMSYQEQRAKELEEKSRFIYKRPQVYEAHRGGLPYGAQEKYHATVEAALRVWVDMHSSHVVCVSPREARIGVLALELPACGEFRDQYAWDGILDPPGLEIGPINVGTIEDNIPFVSLTSFEFGYAGNAGHRTGQTYACIARGNTIIKPHDSPWIIRFPDTRSPHESCASAEFIVVTG